MRFLVVAYCISSPDGDSLIGVYKRCLRIGAELAGRGHEVQVICPGREKYSDRFTLEASKKVSFLDLSLEVLFEPDIDVQRRKYREQIADAKPDVVVIGEAPLAGSLLHCTIAAVTLGVPVVIVDNAYSPESAARFVRAHGPTADGVLLTGLSNYWMTNPPSHVCQVAPFVRRDAARAEQLLAELDLRPEKLITVLAYETKAEVLASALLERWPGSPPDFLFITRDHVACRARLEPLAARTGARFAALPAPEEADYFGLLASSRLVIGKCGFMQMTECLALGVPFIGVTYLGCFDPTYLPPPAPALIHATRALDADEQTLERAVAALAPDRAPLPAAHDGTFQAVERTADFLERLAPRPRAITSEELAWFGYPTRLIAEALGSLHPSENPTPIQWRAARLRRVDEGFCIDSILCQYELGAEKLWAPLWGRRYATDELFDESLENARAPDSGRRMLAASSKDRMSIEHDAGEGLLPKIEF
jgi:hypothetical protein